MGGKVKTPWPSPGDGVNFFRHGWDARLVADTKYFNKITFLIWAKDFSVNYFRCVNSSILPLN